MSRRHPLRQLGSEIWAQRRILGPLCLAVFCSFAYFVGPPAWNQNSRFALTRAIVERGTLDIDPDHHTTGDKAYKDGHFYSDKAPGSSLLAALPHAATTLVIRAIGAEPPAIDVRPLDPILAELGQTPTVEDMRPGDRLTYNRTYRIAQYISRLLSTSLLAVAGVVALFLLCRRATGSRRNALATTVAYTLATPALAYASSLYGHQSCAVFLLLALALTVLTHDLQAGQRCDRTTPLLVGTCLGWAVLCEYPAAIVVALLSGYACYLRGRRFFLWTIVGGLPWALLLAGYHTLAFGGPLTTGYDYVYLEEFAEGMRIAYGIHTPQAGVMLELLFGRFRGLFYLTPVLMLAVWGLWWAARDRAMTFFRQPEQTGVHTKNIGRVLAGLGFAIIAYYLLLNSGYYMWDGGAALGPRHCVPMLPFLALGLCVVLPVAPRTFAVLFAISLLNMLVGTSASPEAAQAGDPLYNFAWPRLWEATPARPTNLGLWLGLGGMWSLLPLVALWAAVGPGLWRQAARADQADCSISDTRGDRGQSPCRYIEVQVNR